MPEGYTKMRDRFIQEGLSEAMAKKKAAKIWNAKHPSRPVTAKSHGEKKKDRKG